LIQGASIKDVRTKSRKIDPPPPYPKNGKMFALAHSEEFCTKKCGRPHLKTLSSLVRKMSALDKPPFPSDCGRLLRTAPCFY